MNNLLLTGGSGDGSLIHTGDVMSYSQPDESLKVYDKFNELVKNTGLRSSLTYAAFAIILNRFMRVTKIKTI